jgi:anaerobic magnesium-protoporphyrin IX monomethyl ester cyclase
VKGEGEQTLAKIIAGVPPEDIQGIFLRSAGMVAENADSPVILDIENLPFPAYDLIDLDLYQRQLSYAYNHRRQGILLTSRGCGYHCTFCFNQWQGLRLRSADNVYAEIRELYETFHIRDFYIVDDIFNINLKRAFALFDLIQSDGLEIRIYFANGLRTDLVTEEFVDRAVAAGAIWFTYAIE